MPSLDPIPDGFAVRVPTVDDAEAIAELINEVSVAEAGIPWTTTEETRDVLTSPERAAPSPEVLLIDEDGSVAGYLESWTSDPAELALIAFVRPTLWGRGLNTWLIRHGEAWATESLLGSDSPFALRLSRFIGNEAAGRLFVSLGYHYVRTFWMMRVDLGASRAEAADPQGVSIRSFDPDSDVERVYEALREGFDDHWGGPFHSLERWRHRSIDGEGANFDPTLWFVAEEGNEVVGAICCTAITPRADDTGEVGYLAVRRPWRRRGVALALLLSAFAELGRRGIARCELGVDSENPTGATKLYERAGMQVAYGWDVWEKTLGRASDGS
jgi:GNAT superfamily N-acetyltransferase